MYLIMRQEASLLLLTWGVALDKLDPFSGPTSVSSSISGLNEISIYHILRMLIVLRWGGEVLCSQTI